jgi:hypothetical protein
MVRGGRRLIKYLSDFYGFEFLMKFLRVRENHLKTSHGGTETRRIDK